MRKATLPNVGHVHWGSGDATVPAEFVLEGVSTDNELVAVQRLHRRPAEPDGAGLPGTAAEKRVRGEVLQHTHEKMQKEL